MARHMDWDWAYAQSELSANELLVLLTLVWRMDADTGCCFPSVRRLAKDTRLSERAVDWALRRLVSRGLIAMVEDADRLSVLRRAGASAMTDTTVWRVLAPDPASRAYAGAGGHGQAGASKEEHTHEQTQEHTQEQRESAARHSHSAKGWKKANGAMGSEAGTRRVKQPLPDDWNPGDEGAEYAKTRGIPDNGINKQWRRFANWHKSHDTQSADWLAEWRLWCDNYQPERQAS